MKKIEDIIIEGMKREGVIKTSTDGNVYIEETDINQMCSTLSDEAMIKKIARNKKIDIKLDVVTKQDRSKLVRDYGYGNYIDSKDERRDTPIYAVLKYDEEGNLIYEDYDRLVEFLEEEFLPKNIEFKKKKRTNDSREYPFLQFNKLVKLQLSEKEMEFAINHLNAMGIYVRGKSSEIDQEFENYDYYVTHKNTKLSEQQSSEDINKKIIEYKTTSNQKKKEELREEIINDNLRLAKWVAYKYAIIYNSNIDEICSYAYEGLIVALEKFDLKGFQFSTYAVPVMASFIKRGYRYNQFNKNSNWNEDYLRAKRIVEQMNNCKIKDNPELLQDVNELMVTYGNYNSKENMLRINYYATEAQLYLEDIEEEQYDSLQSEDKILDTEKKLDQELLKERLDEVLSTLTPREATVIKLRFGLYDGRPRTLEEVANQFFVKGERIRQIEAKALRKLRHSSRSKQLKGFI